MQSRVCAEQLTIWYRIFVSVIAGARSTWPETRGVTPARVSFDHSDDSGDIDYFLGLVRRGYLLGMDHVHRGMSLNVKPSFERRVECIQLFIDAGFAHGVFLSQDSEFGGSLLPDEAKEMAGDN